MRRDCSREECRKLLDFGSQSLNDHPAPGVELMLQADGIHRTWFKKQPALSRTATEPHTATRIRADVRKFLV